LRATGKEEVGLVVVQFACERRRYLPFETSPPGPLSTKWRGGKKKARLFAGVPPLQLRWRGGQGVRFRRAGTSQSASKLNQYRRIPQGSVKVPDREDASTRDRGGGRLLGVISLHGARALRGHSHSQPPGGSLGGAPGVGVSARGAAFRSRRGG